MPLIVKIKLADPWPDWTPRRRIRIETFRWMQEAARRGLDEFKRTEPYIQIPKLR